MARLSMFVHVADKNGDIHAFGPDDDVPAWAVKSITNPGVWAEAPETAKASASTRKTAAKTATVTKTVTPEPPKTETPAPTEGGQAPKPAPGEAFAAETGSETGDSGAGDDQED
ncbi:MULTISPECIES: hypothetical protein [unclassified Rhodococcus (in: high G+C Gram-positive bacteria)]|uniref:hypothetical protein n=1 Tax=unclassified Rhodococcus (in: high G+C Gram-positive bacteria) TaxID=192944 RepID=UPI00117A2389|nr:MULTISPECIES: hypothetical protein [unclassified Rhodococcus (in: high G+C Gram-positive bacteria)]